MFLDVNSSAAITGQVLCQPRGHGQGYVLLTDREPREDENDAGRRDRAVAEDVATQCGKQPGHERDHDRDGDPASEHVNTNTLRRPPGTHS